MTVYFWRKLRKRIVQESKTKKASKRTKPSWAYVEYGEPVLPEKLIFGSSISLQLDDRYRNGPKGASFMLTSGNIVEGKRERKAPAKENFLLSPPAKPKKSRSEGQIKRPRPKREEREPSPSPPHDLTFLARGTASRGPLNAPRKTLNELYPWRALADNWMQRATSRMDERPGPEWVAQQKSIAQYSQGYPLFMGGPEQELLRRMWQICQSIPGEGSSQEPLYGEINLQGTARLFAIWKELCGFGSDSEFLDVGSGLAKMVFHAAIDPGVRRSHGIEMSKYRADTAASILKLLLPKAGIAHVADRVELLHQDVKTAVSWQGITHIYMFDLGFPADPYKGPYSHILKLWEEADSAEYMISYRKPIFLWQRGFNLQLVTKLSVKQQGNTAGSHCAYFYRKIRDVAAVPALPLADAAAAEAAAAQAAAAGAVADVPLAEEVPAPAPLAAAAAAPVAPQFTATASLMRPVEAATATAPTLFLQQQ